MDIEILKENIFLEKYKLFSIDSSYNKEEYVRVYHGYLNRRVCLEAYKSEAVIINAELKIAIPNSYPFAFPKVFFLKKGFPIKLGIDQHVSEDTGLMCLGIPWEIRKILKKDPSLINIMETLIIPHIAGTIYSIENGGSKYPQGEYSHGTKGYIEGLEEYFSISLNDNPQKLKELLGFLQSSNNVAKNTLCPFGCGVIYKKCRCKGNIKPKIS